MKKIIILLTALVAISANFVNAQSSQVTATASIAEVKQVIEETLLAGDTNFFVQVRPAFSLYDFCKEVYLQDTDTAYSPDATVIAKRLWEVNVDKGYSGGKSIIFGVNSNEDIMLPVSPEQIGIYYRPITKRFRYKMRMIPVNVQAQESLKLPKKTSYELAQFSDENDEWEVTYGDKDRSRDHDGELLHEHDIVNFSRTQNKSLYQRYSFRVEGNFLIFHSFFESYVRGGKIKRRCNAKKFYEGGFSIDRGHIERLQKLLE